MIVLFSKSTLKSTYLRPFPFCMMYDTNDFFRKQILGPYWISSLRILDSDFWALGHVRNSRVSSIVNLQCHLTQGINTYGVL